MSRRDYRHRETKKPKKDAKRLPQIGIIPVTANVEVTKKRKKRGGEEEEDS